MWSTLSPNFGLLNETRHHLYSGKSSLRTLIDYLCSSCGVCYEQICIKKRKVGSIWMPIVCWKTHHPNVTHMFSFNLIMSFSDNFIFESEWFFLQKKIFILPWKKSGKFSKWCWYKKETTRIRIYLIWP